MVGLDMSYFMATSSKPGAIMELPNAVTKVYIATWDEKGKSVNLVTCH